VTSSALILLAPLVLAIALVALAMYLRSGPPTAHGKATRTTPRRRRQVAPWVITVLRPLFTYNPHRRAYVLRGIGTRRGPVLRLRPDPGETPRTGRFQRGVEPAPEETVPEAPPRAPVGARGASRPPAGKRNS
jgi:hypothetical protein